MTSSGRATYTIPIPTDEVAAECHRVFARRNRPRMWSYFKRSRHVPRAGKARPKTQCSHICVGPTLRPTNRRHVLHHSWHSWHASHPRARSTQRPRRPTRWPGGVGEAATCRTRGTGAPAVDPQRIGSGSVLPGLPTSAAAPRTVPPPARLPQ